MCSRIVVKIHVYWINCGMKLLLQGGTVLTGGLLKLSMQGGNNILIFSALISSGNGSGCNWKRKIPLTGRYLVVTWLQPLYRTRNVESSSQNDPKPQNFRLINYEMI